MRSLMAAIVNRTVGAKSAIFETCFDEIWNLPIKISKLYYTILIRVSDEDETVDETGSRANVSSFYADVYLAKTRKLASKN